MPTFVRTEQCDGCHGRDKPACMHICTHDLMLLDRDGSLPRRSAARACCSGNGVDK